MRCERRVQQLKGARPDSSHVAGLSFRPRAERDVAVVVFISVGWPPVRPQQLLYPQTCLAPS